MCVFLTLTVTILNNTYSSCECTGRPGSQGIVLILGKNVFAWTKKEYKFILPNTSLILHTST